jgi:hypothetical protein
MSDHGISNPDELRDEASRLSTVGSAFGADTSHEEQAMEEEANQIESEEDRRGDWEKDEYRDSEPRELCRDEELDSMFGTL